MDLVRKSLAAMTLLIGAASLTACSSMGESEARLNTLAQPEQLQPVENSSVASQPLPPIGGNGSIQTLPNDPQATPGTPGAPTTTASTDSSFATLDPLGTTPGPMGRDLTGGLTVEKLRGVWTVVSGATQCRLNLTQTTKSGTGRYRASTPGCQIAGLVVVASWQIAGTQVQLFDEKGTMIAALILSGNRFIGTLAGGQGISMVG